MSIEQKIIFEDDLTHQLKDLNKKYRSLNVHQRIEMLYRDFEGSDVMLTSSFAATSAMLLKFFLM